MATEEKREAKHLIFIRLVLGLIFILSGVLKMINPGKFVFDIQAFDLVPYRLAYFTAIFLPWLEVIAGISLVIKKLYLGALSILADLMIIFIGILIFAWQQGLSIDCGCFGEWLVIKSFPLHLLFNFCLLFGFICLLIKELKLKSA